MRIVEVNGQEIEFPSSMSDDAIKEVLREKFPPQTKPAPDQQKQGRTAKEMLKDGLAGLTSAGGAGMPGMVAGGLYGLATGKTLPTNIPAVGVDNGLLPFANQRIAGAFGGAADLVAKGINIPYRATTGEELYPPSYFENKIRGGMQAIGVTLPEQGRQPETMAQHIGAGIGDVGGALLPMGAVASQVAKGTGIAANIAGRMMGGAAAHPIAAGSMELASGAGMGAGEYIGRRGTGGSDVGATIGAIAGGIGSPLAMGAATMPLGRRAVAGMIAPFTETGGKVRAAKRLQSQMKEPQTVDVDSPLSPAQQTGERRLLELERAVDQSDPVLEATRQTQVQGVRERAKAEMAVDGRIADTQQAVAARRDAVLQKARAMKDGALRNAEESIARLEPANRPSQASNILRGELDNALATVRLEESRLWKAVPQDTTVSNINTRKTIQQIKKNTPKAQIEDAPIELVNRVLKKEAGANTGLLDASGNPIVKPASTADTVLEMQGLRSELLERARAARAEGRNNAGRLHEDMADAVLEDLGAQAGNIKGEVGQRLRDALDYSRGVSETFRQGAVGRVLKSDRVGGDRVAAEITLESILGAGRVKGDVGFGEILAATDTPQTRQAASDYMLARLNRSAVRNGELNVNMAQNFIIDNEDILSRFPNLRQNIADAIKHQRDVARLSGREDALKKSLTSSQKSVAAKFLNAPVEKEIDAIMGASNPKQTANQLMRMARGNPDAQKGVRAATSEYLMKESSTGSFDEVGNDIVSGSKMYKILTDPRLRPAFREILGEDGVKRVQIIATQLRAVEKLPASTQMKIIDDVPSKLIMIPARVMAARASGKVSGRGAGASLQAAQMASGAAKEYMGKMTNDKAAELLKQAMHDPVLFNTLMTETKTAKQAKQAGVRFNAWLLSVGRDLIEDDEE